MKNTPDRPPLVQKRRRLLIIRIVGLVALLAAIALLWNDLTVLGAVAGAIILLTVTGFYVVEVLYSRALERSLPRTKS